MLARSAAGQVVGGMGVAVVGYSILKSNGTYAAGAGAIAFPAVNAVKVTLTAGEVDTFGPLAVFFLDAGGNVVGSILDAVWTFPMDVSTYFLLTFASFASSAQAGGASTMTLNAGEPATDQIYRGLTLEIYSGLGAKQSRTIVDYNGTTKVATVDPAWAIVPDATSVYDIRFAPTGSVAVVDAVAIRAAIGMAAANLDTQLGSLPGLSAAGIRAAVGMAGANLDAQLAELLDDEALIVGVKAKTDLLPGSLSGMVTPSLFPMHNQQ